MVSILSVLLESSCSVGQTGLQVGPPQENTPPAAKAAEHVVMTIGDLYRFLVNICLSIQVLYLLESSMAFYSPAVGIA